MPTIPEDASSLRSIASNNRSKAGQLETVASGLRSDATQLEGIATRLDALPTTPPVIPPVTPPSVSNAPKGTFIQYQPALGSLGGVSAGIARVIFDFNEFRTQASISGTGLNKAAHDAQAVKSANAKAIGRIVHSYTGANSNVDASPANGLNHIAQLGPILAPFIADGTIFAIEAGLAGKWGEWHYSGFPSDTGPYGNNWYGNDWSKFMTLLQKELDTFACPILVRYPRMFIYAMEVANGGAGLRGKERLGLHCDSLLADDSWGGTFPSQGAPGEYNKMVTYMAQGRIAVGEFESTGLSDSQLVTHIDRMKALHFRSVSSVYNMTTINKLKSTSHPSGGTMWDKLVANLQLA